MTRGGARPGAGRKPGSTQKIKRVKINLIVAPGTAEWIKTEAESRRIGQGRVVDELVRWKNENN